MAKDQFPKMFDAEVGKIKIESDDRVISGTGITALPNGAVMSKVGVYEFINTLAEKAGLSAVLDETTGTLTINRPENVSVQKRRQELANVYGDRQFSQLDHVSKALINHIIDGEVAEGKHPPKPKPNQKLK